ncbi:hypothetical protein DL765_011651 [Monosporascus sp. GIB2]|nr:hypothetical protein DL765_011651 [Monosporascus sp. GIB2]
MKARAAFLVFVALLQHSEACVQHARGSETHHDAPTFMRRSHPAGPPSKIALTNVRVFNGYRIGTPETIVIDGDVIGKDLSGVKDAIDAKGRILIPGLIDSHIHIPDMAGLEELTSYGVTTALSMSCRNYTRCHALRGHHGLASFFSAGVPATGPGSSHARTFSVPPEQLIYPTSDPTAVVGYAFGNGSDWYKVTAETNGPSQDMQNRLVAAAHALGKKTTTHASDTASWAQAVASLTDNIQHVPSDHNMSAATAAHIRRNGQTVTPTMEIFRAAFANPDVIRILRGTNDTNETYATVVQNVRILRCAGVALLAGSDAVDRFTANLTFPFGITLHNELENLVRVGMTPAEALRAATSVPAKTWGLTDRGVIAPGKRADLVLLDADPLLDISNTRRIARVWVAGIQYLDVAASFVERSFAAGE